MKTHANCKNYSLKVLYLIIDDSVIAVLDRNLLCLHRSDYRHILSGHTHFLLLLHNSSLFYDMFKIKLFSHAHNQ